MSESAKDGNVKPQKLPPYFTPLWVIAIGLFVFWIWNSQRRGSAFDKCSFYTIATPNDMTNRSLYFTYNYQGKIYEGSATIGSNNLGLWYTKKSVLSTRYWVKVSCANLLFKEMQWEVKVPDTLQYIPPNGWDKIPYSLEEYH